MLRRSTGTWYLIPIPSAHLSRAKLYTTMDKNLYCSRGVCDHRSGWYALSCLIWQFWHSYWTPLAWIFSQTNKVFTKSLNLLSDICVNSSANVISGPWTCVTHEICAQNEETIREAEDISLRKIGKLFTRQLAKATDNSSIILNILVCP